MLFINATIIHKQHVFLRQSSTSNTCICTRRLSLTDLQRHYFKISRAACVDPAVMLEKPLEELPPDEKKFHKRGYYYSEQIDAILFWCAGGSLDSPIFEDITQQDTSLMISLTARLRRIVLCVCGSDRAGQVRFQGLSFCAHTQGSGHGRERISLADVAQRTL